MVFIKLLVAGAYVVLVVLLFGLLLRVLRSID